MSDPFVGEIRLFGGSFAPRGWALCAGQLLSIAQNTALFSLFGTMYGGDGRVTFGLPNLQGTAPMMFGQGPGLSARYQGETAGEQFVTLLSSEMPSHPHVMNCFNAGGDNIDPTGRVWGSAMVGRQGTNLFVAPSGGQAPSPTQMNPLALTLSGGGGPHNNMPPYLTLNFIVALQGIFPQRP